MKNLTQIFEKKDLSNWLTHNRIYRRLAFDVYKMEKVCSRCGIGEIPGKKSNIHVHHKDENRTNNQKENYEILCSLCHHRHHLQGKVGLRKGSKMSDESKKRIGEDSKNRIRKLRATKFRNVTQAFEHMYTKIMKEGIDFSGTKTIFNQGFVISGTAIKTRIVNSKWRKLDINYLESEYLWYLSGDPSVQKLGEIYGKIPEIWKRMADEKGNVNSNYGTRWIEGNQLDYVINELRNNPESRRACLTIFDGKNNKQYSKDTPCTMGLSFYIVSGKLCISVMMRSNDIIFGTPIDVYCFSMLQQMVADELGIPMGQYSHFNVNFHCYERHWNMKSEFEAKSIIS